MEATDGEEALEIMKKESIDLLMLDVVMPKTDGVTVLKKMNEMDIIKDIPVVMISTELSSDLINNTYDLGAVDYITRPFDVKVVKKRVVNTLLLYAKQKKLTMMVEEQVKEREKNNNMMVSILSNIVEFRNGESGLHVRHVKSITEVLLRNFIEMNSKYEYLEKDIHIIGMASSLHDVGKISIPEEILNKPGKLTNEEFDLMKTHTTIGAQMLANNETYKEEPLLNYAYEIAFWHHERYDGRGYPQGLKGDEIPISAQVVSIADVYDALTSERVYKAAFSHEKAMDMILHGECGTFNPALLECLEKCQFEIRDIYKTD